MGRNDENQGFSCCVCGLAVVPLANGSYRNHCPACLASLHVDEEPGDRASGCVGRMDAVALRYSRKGLQLVHRCSRCGAVRFNRVATGGIQGDEVEALARLPVWHGEDHALGRRRR